MFGHKNETLDAVKSHETLHTWQLEIQFLLKSKAQKFGMGFLRVNF